MNYLKHEKLKITLWNELAENFDEDAITSMSEPIVIAFVALSVKQYRGNSLLLYYEKYKYIYKYYAFNKYITILSTISHYKLQDFPPCLNSTRATAYYLNPDITEAKTLKRRFEILFYHNFY